MQHARVWVSTHTTSVNGENAKEGIIRVAAAAAKTLGKYTSTRKKSAASRLRELRDDKAPSARRLQNVANERASARAPRQRTRANHKKDVREHAREEYGQDSASTIDRSNYF